MKFSKEWLLSDFADLSGINEQDLVSAMTALGHRMEIHHDHYDIESPACRPDCCSVVGIAREMCAAVGIPFRYDAPTVHGCEDTSIFEMLDVDVWDEQLCNRLTCRMAYQISIFPSPEWLQKRLLACGIAPVNCIEDIAQYVMLELGQPLLILDQRCISTGSLILRQAFPGESDEEAVVLGDELHPIVIGNSICDEEASLRSDTDCVIICAIHHSESTNDSMLTHTAVERMCQLIETISCGTVADGTIDILNFVPHERRISCSVEEINRILNTDFTAKALISLLQPTGITMVDGEFAIPSHRPDLTCPEDIAEEIHRIHTAQTR